MVDERKRNYYWENGLLKNKINGEVVEMCVWLVVPAGRHKEVMGLDHNLPLAGHLGEKKTHEILKHHFTWPEMWNGIKA